jgi:hypothetical protein
MRIKITRAIIAQKKAEAHAANSTWDMVSKPIVRSYVLPAKHRTSYATWLGIKACHKRSGMDTFTQQERYAMG